MFLPKDKFEIYHLTFPSQFSLTSTLMRFQEFYESPEFRGKYFSREEYIDWYASTHNNRFSYFEDWSGFNFPSHVLQPFYDGKMLELTQKEQEVLNVFRKIEEPFYVIGTYKNSKKENVIHHELVHALYYTVPEYKEFVDSILKRSNLDDLYRGIALMGYHDSVLIDEANAYIMTGLDDSLEEIQVDKVAETKIELKSIFKQFFGVDPETNEGINRLIKKIKQVQVLEVNKTTFRI